MHQDVYKDKLQKGDNMSKFLQDNFLLENKKAIDLYNTYAKDMPVYDFHCHLDAKEIADNHHYETITDVWLKHDHYKWRLMRWYGVEEKYITGNATDYEKFEKFAEVISYAYGNPVYLWSHMELKKFFGIEEALTKDNAKEIYNQANETLKTLSVHEMIRQSNVQVICTTDDPLDDLKYHKKIKESQSLECIVAPTFRPDRLLKLDHDALDWIITIASLTEKNIKSITDLIEALESRIDYFHEHGCRMSDHSIEASKFKLSSENEANDILSKLLSNQYINDEEKIVLRSYILVELGKLYEKKDWTMQLHIGAMRDNNRMMLKKTGKDSGFDALNDENIIEDIRNYLNELALKGQLPKSILYCLNPKDYTPLAVLSGCYQGPGIKGKVQLGAAWWFNDHKRGIKEQIEIFASTGLLSQSVGMLTDSRSFLSFTRHDYYRRILCSLVGQWIENGEIAENETILKTMIEGISFYNAQNLITIK